MASLPYISIIIPVYNSELFIGRCLDGCISQSFKNFEVIVVNDGSTDSTAKIINEYVKKDARILCIHKENEGVNFARKTGIEKAIGKYLFFLDGDDKLPFRALEYLYESSVNNDADIIVGNVEIQSLDGLKVVKKYDSFKSGSGISFIEFILKKKLFYLWGKLIKRSLYTDNKILINKSLVIGEDQIQLYQLGLYAKNVVCIQEVVYHYIIHALSATQFKTDIKYAETQEIYAFNIIQLQNVYSYNLEIYQLLNLRIIEAFYRAAGQYGCWVQDKKKLRKAYFKALNESVFHSPTLFFSYFIYIVIGYFSLIFPKGYYWFRKIYKQFDKKVN